MYQLDTLARRVSLGVGLRASTDGAQVLSVIDGGTGHAAGVRPGDRIVALNGAVVPDAASLAAASRALVRDAAVALVVERDGVRLALHAVATPLPLERLAGAHIEPGHVATDDGTRLRTLFAAPAHAPPPWTAVLHLPGLGTTSCELTDDDPRDPFRAFLEGCAARGLATMRLERSGMGDSEGPSFRDGDLFAELAGYRAAIAALAARPDVARVALFGHSVGGMLAPLLASEGAGVARVAVLGTTSRAWHACAVRALRRQRAIGGVAPDALEHEASAWLALHARVCQGGMTPEQVFAQDPALRRALEGAACRGETIYGRHVSFFQQLERVDLEALWSTVGADVLVLHGEHDVTCDDDDARGVARAAARARPTRLEFLEGIGHDLRRHASLERAWAAPREGRWDGRVVAALAAWLADPTP